MRSSLTSARSDRTRARAWLPVAFAMFTCGWGGNQFTPLLVMYRQDGYSVLVVDSLLGAYVVGLVPGLLLLGRLSDRWGRRPVVLSGTALSLIASACIALGEWGAGWIAAGRLITGVGLAAAMAAGSTWVKELSAAEPGSAEDAGPRRSALWLTLGLGLGPGVAGAMAQWAPWPRVLPFTVHMALCVAALWGLRRIRETAPRTQAATSERRGDQTVRGPRPRVGVRHPRFSRIILPLAPWIFGSLGVAYAIMPQVVGSRLGSWGLAYSTLLTIAALGAGVGIQPLAKRLDRADSARAPAVALTVVATGLAMSAVTATLGSVWLAVLTAAVLGTGYGIALVAGLLEIQRLAPPSALAGLTGVFYTLAYIGFLLPAALAALSPLVGYPTMLATLTLLALAGLAVVSANSRRHTNLREAAPSPQLTPDRPGR